MSDYLFKYAVVHFVCSLIGLMTTLFTERFIRVRYLVFAAAFGPFYMIHEWSDLDAIIIDLRKRKVG